MRRLNTTSQRSLDQSRAGPQKGETATYPPFSGLFAYSGLNPIARC